jgi:serine phosphatase RsbU (regulator of sigma subunit)
MDVASVASVAEAVGVVLLVEDDAADALLAREYLAEETAGAIRVDWARSLGEALAAITPATECVLLDLGLPDRQGLDALAAVMERAPSVPVVVLTGLGERSTGLAAVGAGAEDYLLKDEVTPSSLWRSVRYAVERRRNDERERQLLEAELRRQENQRLERGLLPSPRLRDADLRWASRYAPAGASTLLGGDFVDALELDDGTVRLVIGDVCGHGPEEAALGASLRIAWRTLVLAGAGPTDTVGTLEELLVVERHEATLFTSVADLAIAADRRSASVLLAGHPVPILLAGGRATTLEVDGGPLLGVGLPVAPPTRVALPEHWGLLLYTDGVFEGRTGVPGERLGVDGLLGVLDALAPKAPDAGELLDAALVEVELRHGGPLADDVALFVLDRGGWA